MKDTAEIVKLRVLLRNANMDYSALLRGTGHEGKLVRLELLPVPRTLGLGVMMGLEVADGTTQFQPGVQARGGAVGAGARGLGCAGGA